MAGKVIGGSNQSNHDAYVRNLRYAASVLEPAGIVGLIEPISKYGVPGYYLDNYERGGYSI